MGAMLSLHLAVSHGDRFRAVVLGGLGTGEGGMADPGRRESIAAALLADDPATITGEIPQQFRRFAEANHNDLKALAACMSRDRPQMSPEIMAQLRMPVMIAIGTKDTLVGSADRLAAMIPGAQLVTLEGRDHINAVGDPRILVWRDSDC
jgi:pimeloyl-ACP methyl ester carboxylesterase